MYSKKTQEVSADYFNGNANITEGNVTDTAIGGLAEIVNNINDDLEGLQIPVSEVGVKQAFVVNDAGGAARSTDVSIPAGVTIQVLDVKVINRSAGVSADTLKVQKFPSGGPAVDITDAMGINKADKAITRAGTIDDANWSLDGDSLDSIRVATTDAGATGDIPATTTIIEFVRTA